MITIRTLLLLWNTIIARKFGSMTWQPKMKKKKKKIAPILLPRIHCMRAWQFYTKLPICNLGSMPNLIPANISGYTVVLDNAQGKLERRMRRQGRDKEETRKRWGEMRLNGRLLNLCTDLYEWHSLKAIRYDNHFEMGFCTCNNARDHEFRERKLSSTYG